MKKFLKLLLIFLLVCGGLFLVYNYSHNQNNQVIDEPISEPVKPEEEKIKEDGYYYSKEDVALYIHTYNRLPVNFITKNEARKKGYKASKQNLWKILDGYCLGGDVFANREGSLPKKKGRTYYECDINYNGKTRNAERIIYSNDGLIYYTKDHYKTFELLYGEEQ